MEDTKSSPEEKKRLETSEEKAWYKNIKVKSIFRRKGEMRGENT